MNLLTNSLADCCQFVAARVCDFPMCLVLTPDQDLLVLPHASDLEEGSLSFALKPGSDKMAVLLTLTAILNRLMTSLQMRIKPRGRPSAGAR